MDTKINLLKSQLGENRLKENVDISEYLETKRGTIGRGFYLATTEDELVQIIQLCRELDLKYLIIGLGTKILLEHDSPFEGIVIKNRADNLKIFGIKGKISKAGLGISEAFIEASSGASLKAVAEYAQKQTLTGLEGISKTPGTLGGSINSNPTLRDQVYQVKILTPQGKIQSALLNEIKRDDIILSVLFKLRSKFQ